MHKIMSNTIVPYGTVTSIQKYSMATVILILLSQHQPGGGRVSLWEAAFKRQLNHLAMQENGTQEGSSHPSHSMCHLLPAVVTGIKKLSFFFPEIGEFG